MRVVRARRHHLPAGPAQPGRRRPGARRRRPGRSCCSRTGKVDAWVRLVRTADDEVVLDVDGGHGDARARPAATVPAAHQGRRRPARLAGRWRCGARAPRPAAPRPAVGPGRSARAGRLAGRRGRRRARARRGGARRRRPCRRPRRLRVAAHPRRRAGHGRRADRDDDPGRGRPVGHRRLGRASPRAASPARSWSPASTAGAATCPATCAAWSLPGAPPPVGGHAGGRRRRRGRCGHLGRARTRRRRGGAGVRRSGRSSRRRRGDGGRRGPPPSSTCRSRAERRRRWGSGRTTRSWASRSAATADEVRAAYRRAARDHHPDAGGDAARMTDLNAAWHVLGDPARRAAYDRELARRLATAGGRAAPPPPRARAWAGRGTRPRACSARPRSGPSWSTTSPCARPGRSTAGGRSSRPPRWWRPS